MGSTIKGIFLILIFALVSVIQWNLDSDKTATRQIKNTLELAVHDASLALDESQLSQGYIVFDQVQARTNFEESLKYHLKLDNNLIPISNSFYQHEIKIKHLEYIDDRTVDPSNPPQLVSFPYVYQNSKYDIVDVLDGPSVIAVLETRSPRYFAGNSITIRQAAVYEYKF